jgi:hypothetical protein
MAEFFLDVAGAEQNTDYNYHVVASDQIVWPYLSSDLGILSVKKLTPDRELRDITVFLSVKTLTQNQSVFM